MVVLGPFHTGTSRSPDTICTCCGTANSTTTLKTNAMRRAVAAFVLVPSLTITLTVLIGVESTIANVTLAATAWTVLGIPAAGLALKSAFAPACRYCGSPDLAGVQASQNAQVLPG